MHKIPFSRSRRLRILHCEPVPVMVAFVVSSLFKLYNIWCLHWLYRSGNCPVQSLFCFVLWIQLHFNCIHSWKKEGLFPRTYHPLLLPLQKVHMSTQGSSPSTVIVDLPPSPLVPTFVERRALSLLSTFRCLTQNLCHQYMFIAAILLINGLSLHKLL